MMIRGRGRSPSPCRSDRCRSRSRSRSRSRERRERRQSSSRGSGSSSSLKEDVTRWNLEHSANALSKMGMFTNEGKARVKEMESQQMANMMDSLCGFGERKKLSRGKKNCKDTIIVMNETIDSTRKPSGEELDEYMRWLGMDLKEHAHLRWIAFVGLTSKIEAEWKPCKIQETGQIFYFNFKTGESIWEHPVDVRCKAMFERYQKTNTAGFRFQPATDAPVDTPPPPPSSSEVMDGTHMQ